MECGTQCSHAAEWDTLAQELREEALDPTLASCCQRDLEEQAAAARLTAQLSAADRSNVRKEARAAVLRCAPTPAAAEDEEAELLEGSDDDVALAKFRALRLEELQRQRAQQQRLQAQGHGTLTSVPASRLLETATTSAAPVVCHIAAEGYEACDVLDEHLDVLAHRHLSTRFVRSVLPHGRAHLLHSLGLAGPGLACFREGALVGSTDVGAFLGEGEDAGGGDLREEAVTAWLRRRRVLRSQEQQSHGGGLQEADAEGDSLDEAGPPDDGGLPPCEVCGRRYPHEHIRSVYGAHGDSDEEDDR